jgi:hypothetical protein
MVRTPTPISPTAALILLGLLLYGVGRNLTGNTFQALLAMLLSVLATMGQEPRSDRLRVAAEQARAGAFWPRFTSGERGLSGLRAEDGSAQPISPRERASSVSSMRSLTASKDSVTASGTSSPC